MEIYSGKAKDIVKEENNKVKLIFRDSITAFDGVKTDQLLNKGKINCQTSVKIFEILENYGLDTHYVSTIDENKLLCEEVEIIPVEVVCRNVSAGSFCRRYGTESGEVFIEPLIEFFYKNDELHDPLVDKNTAISLGWVSEKEAVLMECITRAVNHILSEIFSLISLKLVDFKLEFGRSHDKRLLIADEISADSMRLWEHETGEIKDKDRYRKDLGDVILHYEDILNRLNEIEKLPDIALKTKANVSIILKDSVLDPAGEVTFRSLKRNEYSSIESVKLGKKARLEFSVSPSNSLYTQIEEISEKILSNPLIESYAIELEYANTSHFQGD